MSLAVSASATLPISLSTTPVPLKKLNWRLWVPGFMDRHFKPCVFFAISKIPIRHYVSIRRDILGLSEVKKWLLKIMETAPPPPQDGAKIREANAGAKPAKHSTSPNQVI